MSLGKLLLAIEVLFFTAVSWVMPVRVRKWLMAWPGTWLAYKGGAAIVGGTILCAQGSTTATMLLVPFTFGFGLVPRDAGPDGPNRRRAQRKHAALVLHHLAPVLYVALPTPPKHVIANAAMFAALWLAHAIDMLDDRKKTSVQAPYLALVVRVSPPRLGPLDHRYKLELRASSLLQACKLGLWTT